VWARVFRSLVLSFGLVLGVVGFIAGCGDGELVCEEERIAQVSDSRHM
jgi:hypothetical protein